MTMLISSFLLPAIKNYSFKQWKRLLLIYPIIFMVPYVFYKNPYTNLSVDALMGIVFAYILYNYFINDKSLIGNISIALGLLILPLIKTSGMIFALVAVIIIFIDAIIVQKKYKIQIVSTYLTLVLLPFISYLMWRLNLFINTVGNTFTYNLNTITYIKTSVQDWQLKGFINFYKAILNYNAIPETSQTKFFIGPFPVSAIIWIVLLAALLLLLYFMNGKKKRDLVFYSLFYCGCILYTVSVSFLYMVSFGEGEDEILSSFKRYLSTYYIAILVFFIFSIVEFIRSVNVKNLSACPELSQLF